MLFPFSALLTFDAERILGGINMKGPLCVSIARHGSLVMWGFHSRPEQLTDAGRRLYLNTLAYAVAHKGASVETLRLRPTRGDLDRAFGLYLGLYPADRQLGMVQRHFTGEPLPESLLTDAALRARWVAERRPFVHPVDDGSKWETAYQLAVDAQCRELGFANDSLQFLDALAARLETDAADGLAATLLGRYVPDVAPAAFGGWLREHREQLYFTEAGGWVWRVRGQRAVSPQLHTVDGERDELVRLAADVTATRLKITMRVRKGWHAWSPKAVGQEPVVIAILPGSSFELAGDIVWSDDEHGMLEGYSEIELPIRRVGDCEQLRVAITYMVCGEACASRRARSCWLADRGVVPRAVTRRLAGGIVAVLRRRLPMNLPSCAVALYAVVVASAPLPELIPHPSAFRMANEAHAIVEGTLQADGSVAVTMRHFVADGLQVADSIRVKGLAGMQMVVDPFGALGRKAAPIEPDAVLLFLDALGNDGQWSAVHHYGDAARGVLWLVGEQVFGYAQAINPGPYVLGVWTGRIDGGALAELMPDEVRAEVAAGRAARALWQKTMAIADPALRAKALAVWCSPETSPDGRWYVERCRELFAAGEVLGAAMVAPLARVVQSDTSSDAAGLAADMLGRLGEPAKAAVPSLIARLRDLRGASPQRLLQALRPMRDERARDVLRDYVLHDDPFVAALAGQALAETGDPGAAALLAARVPGMIFSSREVAGLGLLLDALHDLDPVAAEDLLRERFLDWDALTARRDWTRRVRDEAAGRGR